MNFQPKKVKIGSFEIGQGQDLFLIAGPCVIESEKLVADHARRLKEITDELKIPFIFKSSYDKANRTSVDSFRGPGVEEGLKILKRVKKDVGVMMLSDVHNVAEVEAVAEVVDVIQIPALLCRQTDLVLEAARTKKVVNVKKGQFMAPMDMERVIEKIRSVGNEKIILTERGTSFGYHTLVNDFRSLMIMREWGYPIVFDATHSVQQPSAWGKVSGGQREFVPGLARAAVAVGCEGLFMEVHENPDKALSDGPNMVPMDQLKQLLISLKAVNEAVS
jgi:2-dehydro-3-deoxyphosphooctonate aldolase (KDO 8-P synthase)